MRKILNRRNNSDVVIIGAGLAGVCAAITAARRGAQVTLIEKESVPGGTAIGMRHRFLCGLFLNSKSFPRKYLNQGLIDEFCKCLSPSKPVRMGKVWLLPYDPQRLVIVLDNLLFREKNIQVAYSSMVSSCSCKQGRIESVKYSHRGKDYKLVAKSFIDAGAGILIQMCKATQSLDISERQMSGFSIEMAGVTWEEDLSIRVPYVLYQAAKRGELPLYARWTSVTSHEKKGKIHLKLSLPALATFTLAKKISTAVVRILRQDLPAFHSGKIVWKAEDVFARDGDCLRGKYVFKDNDVLLGKKFSDGIMKGAWPMEFWDLKRGPIYKYLNEDYYELPKRSLTAKNVSNLFAAGRLVSAESGAQASLRAGGLCLAMGEAAGNIAVAYSLKAEHGAV
jgi:hypothetical protein